MSVMASPIPPHLNASPIIQTSPQAGGSPKSTRTRGSPSSSPQQPSPGSPRSALVGVMDVEGLLRSHGGDLKRALESVIAERNNLQSQNSQLWKLIEKQRAQSSHLTADNDRLRADRERANNRLIAAGLEPVVSNIKQRLPNSNSAVGLGLRAESQQPAPIIRRHNSDRDNMVAPPLSSLQVPGPSNSAPSSPANELPPSIPPPVYRNLADGTTNGLLPSPMAERKSRHESRMTFSPEVSSFMSLVDEPEEAAPAMVPSTSNVTLSPTSVYSQSPETTSRTPMVPPPSGRALTVTTEMPEPEEEERQIRPPSPLPHRSSSVASYRSNDIPPPDYSRPRTPQQMPYQPHDMTSPRPSQDSLARGSVEAGPTAIKPLNVNNEKRSLLPRLTPQLLPHARITLPTSSVYQNQNGRDVLCFIVSVTVRTSASQQLTWNVAKLFSAFIDLDTRIRARSGKSTKEWKRLVVPLPDGRTWKDFAPSKIDQRKATLQSYLQSLLVAPLSDKSDLCSFLSTDPVQPKSKDGRKEGYLTKKGKNFGGWKTRFFVLDGPQMEYYETRGGPHLGSIMITNAQIGRQNRPSDSNDDRDFRHAFLIIETKKGTANRHVLCAESDQERDSWIEMLVRQVDPEAGPSHSPAPIAPLATVPTPMEHKRKTSMSSITRKMSKDVVVTAAQPISSMPDAGSKLFGAPSPSLFNSMENQKAQAQVQGRQNGQLALAIPGSQSSMAPPASQLSPQAGQADSPTSHGMSMPSFFRSTSSSSQSAQPTTILTSPSSETLSSSPPVSTSSESAPISRSAKRQSVMPPPPRQSFSPAYLSKLSQDGMSAPPGYQMPDKDRERKAKSGRFWSPFSTKVPEKAQRPVFGVPLSDSIAIATVANLPAIVFRCIEYLEAKRAEEEEGIYRLSGSSAVIKGLKDRFNIEGDVNLLQLDDRWDPHAIAGLLKTFLRELPTSLLTHDLHLSFLSVMDLVESSARVKELSRLVSDLPPPNYALLRALTAHLILIVKNAPTNKMTLRNIGIVFSPTLGIPAGIFSELVSHFGRIFDDDPEEDEDEVKASTEGATVGSEMGETQRRDENSLELLGDGTDGAETIRRKRNSMLYQAGGADAMLGLAGRSLDPSAEDSASELSIEDELDLDEGSEDPSTNSTDNLSTASTSNIRAQLDSSSEALPRSDLGASNPYPSAAVVRRAKAAAKGLGVQTSLQVPQTTSNSSSTAELGAALGGDVGTGKTLMTPGRGVGLPVSPRPEDREGMAQMQAQEGMGAV